MRCYFISTSNKPSSIEAAVALAWYRKKDLAVKLCWQRSIGAAQLSWLLNGGDMISTEVFAVKSMLNNLNTTQSDILILVNEIEKEGQLGRGILLISALHRVSVCFIWSCGEDMSWITKMLCTMLVCNISSVTPSTPHFMANVLLLQIRRMSTSHAP